MSSNERAGCASRPHSSRSSFTPAPTTGRATPMRSALFAARASFGETFVAALRAAGRVPDSFLAEYGRAPIRGDGGAAAGADRCRSCRDHPRDGACHRIPPGPSRDILAKARPRRCRQRRAHPYEPVGRRRPAGDLRCRRDDGFEQTGARHFCAGILHHMPTICAVTAPSPVSYLRLVPNAWAPTVIDLCAPGPRRLPARLPGFCRRETRPSVARQFNLEFRACDAAASPYLALGAMIFAGADGIRRSVGAAAIGEGSPVASRHARRRT